MKIMSRILTSLFLFGVFTACSAVDIQPDENNRFTAKSYQYYTWGSAPVEGDQPGPGRAIDPTVREAVNRALVEKGYIENTSRAQFSVGYRYGSGIREGVPGDDASNISYYPPTTINRTVDQATRDNAVALGGVKETAELQIQLRDMQSQLIVWQVTLTEIVEDVNKVDAQHIDKRLRKAIPSALKTLPAAP